MARTKVPAERQLTDWDEADKVMQEILIAKGCICEIEIDMNRRIDRIKKAANEAAGPIRKRIEEMSRQIRDFVTAHRHELRGKSRKLTFGETGFRQSTKVTVPTNETADIIRRLREFGMGDCVAVKESVLKDAMRQNYTAEEIERTGAKLCVTDGFWYDVYEESLQKE